jgi:hypothetical protein
MEPYYSRAEELFHVHGDLGAAPSVPGGYASSFDPTEPFHSKKYPYPALANEPRMQSIEDDVFPRFRQPLEHSLLERATMQADAACNLKH